MRVYRQIEHPNKRHRIKLFRDEQRWLYHREDWIKKRWRKTSDSAHFKSYAAALVNAQSAMPWIANAVTPHSWHVELLRGYVFEYMPYPGSYGEHDHCVSCFKRLSSRDFQESNADHAGFATRYEIPDSSGRRQWDWVCNDCFNCLKQSLQWTVLAADAEP